jgi:predicted amidohydrolase
MRAARVFNFGAEIGSLKPGAEAVISVFELQEGSFTFTDSDGKTRTGGRGLPPSRR